MPYDFDKLTDRKNTNSLKYDFAKERGKKEDLIPMWVADMDFPTLPEITTALVKAADHGIFGYTEVKEEYFRVLHEWFLSHYRWDIARKWLIKTPGVVFAIAMAIRAFTKEGDGVLIQRPVYYPFSEAILDNNRRLINNAAVYENGSYHIDFDDFEQKITDNQVKLFVLCNPHNPIGRVYTKEELIRLGDICVKHDVLVVSDEIHADFIHPGHEHLVFASIKEEYASRTITCTAPSKTFNLAGLQVSNVLIPNQALKYKFKEEINKTGYSQLNTMGLIACQAAYEYGDKWLAELNAYIYDNIRTAKQFIETEIPALKVIDTQGTYLLWVDFRALGMETGELENFIAEEAGLWLDGGTMFGPEGKGFERFNVACPRATLLKALNQLRDAVISLE
ncbi:MalY/PatB family protein [Anaerocolumna xylanovorans]|uniref:cysteine-S-conjugate beta-lyase n=1 Tax=Anaerocolumna xylanovorans DSM 12503 TaxID=1121345 RepID=A0A1M7Y470_9FIRM|nr:MalY/PatB family protein [Anaerocolumna xylanovorans]SHO47073.1 cystathione beta-lyase [Anaerocolumna xylanovorans DSM 12503]